MYCEDHGCSDYFDEISAVLTTMRFANKDPWPFGLKTMENLDIIVVVSQPVFDCIYDRLAEVNTFQGFRLLVSAEVEEYEVKLAEEVPDVEQDELQRQGFIGSTTLPEEYLRDEFLGDSIA